MSVSKTELLNVVNDNDEIVGVEDRRKIHKDGLLHREVNVWFYTPEHELVFQHRAKDKDTFPDLLDATVGGHVDMGDSYPTAATREAEEETGLKIRVEDLMPLEKLKLKTFDSATGNTNYAFRTRYAYLFRDDLADLRIEKGKAVGFETYPIDLILSADEEFKKRFVPSVFDPQVLESFRRISTL